MGFINKKKILILMVFFSAFNVFALRFQSKTFIFGRNLNVDNFSVLFNYKEELKQSFYNSSFIFYKIDSNLSDIFESDFLLTLFDTDYMLYDNSFTKNKMLITNYSNKFGIIDNVLTYYKYKINSQNNIYFLYLSDKVEKANRNYTYNENIDALRLFFNNNSEVKNPENLTILIADISYFDFRNIVEKIDFIDYIVNFQDFETGIINSKKIYNIPENSLEVLRCDFLFGRTGFLSGSFSEINLENSPQSQFINRIIAVNK
ncbi:MAG: hypothetical protein WC337_00840 [Candidatus Muiribacteriota bacterium]